MLHPNSRKPSTIYKLCPKKVNSATVTILVKRPDVCSVGTSSIAGMLPGQSAACPIFLPCIFPRQTSNNPGYFHQTCVKHKIWFGSKICPFLFGQILWYIPLYFHDIHINCPNYPEYILQSPAVHPPKCLLYKVALQNNRYISLFTIYNQLGLWKNITL